MRSKLVGLSSTFVAALLLVSTPALAATKKATTTPAAPQPNSANGSASDNGLKIAPVRSDLTIEAGKSQTIQVSVTNVTDVVSSYQVLINDFVASGDESGQPQILLDADKFAPSHSLKRLVGNVPNVTLSPGQTKNVNVPITVPANYKAGGYYGAVRFAPHTDAGASGARNVTLSASVGSLVLVTVPGDINEQVSVASLDARKAVGTNQIDSPRVVFTDGTNINSVVRFQNGGDVQEQPFGKVMLKNWRGKVLATYEVNNGTPRSNVLPDSIRKFTIPLNNKVGGFGKYSLVGNFGYGSTGQLITASSTFYVIPAFVIILVVLFIALVIFLIFACHASLSATTAALLLAHAVVVNHRAS